MSVIPSHKETKYDRQLRLWASSGQDALENSHICLIGANATGCEIAKNLILPGIGQLTIIDTAKVTEEDIASNFFVNGDDDLDKSRAVCVSIHLQELNHNLKCHTITNDIKMDSPDFWLKFTVIIACDVGAKNLQLLSDTLFPLNIPLVIADSIGFYGYLRICTAEHTVIETHPESLVDLRLDVPWGDLQTLAQSYDLSKLTDEEFEHVPYVILLLIFLKQWRENDNTDNQKLPVSYNERNEFKKLIESSRRNGRDHENFEEALAAVWRLSQSSSTLPGQLTTLFGNTKSSESNLSADTPRFWVLVAALRQFVKENNDGLLPLSGALPDMKASTEGFVRLQSVYHQKAESDIHHLRSILNHFHEVYGTLSSSSDISDEDLSTFCKNSRYLSAISGTSLEFSRDTVDGK